MSCFQNLKTNKLCKYAKNLTISFLIPFLITSEFAATLITSTASLTAHTVMSIALGLVGSIHYPVTYTA